MNTKTMNISLNEELALFVNNQIEGGKYQNRSEYVRALVRQDQERVGQERLEALLISGLESGSIKMDSKASRDFDSIISTKIAKVRQKQK